MSMSKKLREFLGSHSRQPREINKDNAPLKELKDFLKRELAERQEDNPEDCEVEKDAIKACITCVRNILKQKETTVDTTDLITGIRRWLEVVDEMIRGLGIQDEAVELWAIASQVTSDHEKGMLCKRAKTLWGISQAILAHDYTTFSDDSDEYKAADIHRFKKDSKKGVADVKLRTDSLNDQAEARYKTNRFDQAKARQLRQDLARLAKNGLRPNGRSPPRQNDLSQAGPEIGPVAKVVGMGGLQFVQNAATRRRLGDTLPVHEVETVAIGSPMASPALGGLALGLVAAAAYLLKRFRQLPRKTKNASEEP